MADLLQFVFVALQYQVFRIEKIKKYNSYKYELFENLQKTIHKDFISVKSSYIDYLKHAIFYWSYWLTLAIIFITGVFWITLFGLGYLIISFIYLWLGQIVLIGKRRNIIRSCNVFLYYNFLVILTKCTFQLMGCVYINILIDNGLCWMVSLFGIQCINPMSWEVREIHVKETNKQCFSVESGLHWDVICFFFIILQRKIFKADPFLLVRLDIHVQNKFSSRGAFYINQEMMKFIEGQKKKEMKELEKIEKKIDEISKRQAQHGKPELNEHYLVLRSGDYYLFDGDLEEEDKEDETNRGSDESLRLPFMSDDEESKSRENTRNICSSQSSFNSHSSVKQINEHLFSSNNFQDIPENNESENLDDDFSLPQYTLNPLQLITRLVKEGPRSAVRQYKRSISESRDKILSRRSSAVGRGNSEICEKCTNQNVCNSGSIRQDSFQSSTKCDNSIIHSFHQNLHVHTPIPSENETFYRSSDDPLNGSLEINVNDVADNIALESCWTKFKNGIKLFLCFINSCMISLTTIFNRWTQEYSKIIRKIEKEKKLVKQVVLSKFIKIDDKLGQEIDEIVKNQSTPVSSFDDIDETQKEYMFLHSKSAFFSLIISFGNIAIIYSEFMCYFILILNHLLSGNLLSLPYPLLVFFWAMLSVPRPSKNFWIVIITYTEIVIVIKYIFQFNMIKFDLPSGPENRINPLSLPLILGVEKTRTNAIIDVIQLLFLFLHRSYLKTNGIWRDHTEFYDDLENIISENNGQNYNKESSDLRNSQKTRSRLYNPIRQIQKFYLKMTNPKLNKRVDVYSVMFLCEFLSILIVIVGYVSFGPGTDSGVNAIDFIKSSKTPVPFIAMIITQFIFFIIDRALFLRKQVKGKFIFLIFHVLLIHAWLFFALPYITKRKFNSQFPPQLLYFVKCIYFALSAYQLKSGYPMRILGNFLTKKYNYANLIAFKIYMGIPFLYELRNVMDWMWTDSTIAFYHWMEVEDIFSKIFVLKCWRYGEKIWPTERGQNRRLIVKYSVGIGLIFVFSLCIWGPLMISSFIGVTFVKYPPVECSFSINVGDYSPIFVFSSRENNMKQLSIDTFVKMKECYHRHSSSKDFLQSFEADDATEIIIDNASDNAWLITPPGLKNLKEKLSYLNETLKINMQAICERETTDSKSTEKIVRFTQSRILSNVEKLKFLVAINTTLNQTDVHLPTIFPRFLTAFKRTLSETRPLHRNQNYTYLNISLTMKIHKSIMWWEISEFINGTSYCSNTTESRKNYSFLTLFIFNERISDNIFGHIFSNYGIIGIYAAYFFVVHRFLRTFYSNISYIIPYEELPNVDRIHKLLHEIYLVRENKKLLLEEQLIAKLIFLFRSSQTMIKWTQQKKSTLEAVVERIREMSQNDSINVMNENVDNHYVVGD